jgi:hypothetical protein
MIINAVTDFDDSIPSGSLKSVSYTIRVPAVANYPEEAVTPARYVVRLYHAPYLANQTLYPITVTGLSKVTASPASGEFRVVDSILRTRPHLLEFNAASAGTAYTVSYYALTSVLDYQFIGNITSGYDVSVPMYVLNGRDHGNNLTVAINDLPSGDKVVFLKNGDYNITTQLTFGTNSVLRLIGESTEGVIITSTIAAGSNHINILGGSIENITVNDTINNTYGTIVGLTGNINSSQLVKNVHVIGSGGTGYGILNCSNVQNCYTTGYQYGIFQCYMIDNCYTELNSSYGYYGCQFISKSSSYQDNSGIGLSQNINNCYISTPNAAGVNQCISISDCSVVNACTYGYSQNKAMNRNKSTGAGTQNYNQTGGAENYSSFAVNATYIINNANGLDTVNGGFNT